MDIGKKYVDHVLNASIEYFCIKLCSIVNNPDTLSQTFSSTASKRGILSACALIVWEKKA